MSSMLGRTGADLESVIAGGVEGFSTEVLLEQYFHLDTIDAMELAVQVRSARIKTANSGSYALSDVVERPQIQAPEDDEDELPELDASEVVPTATINYFANDETIVVNGQMVDVLHKFIRGNSLLAFSDEQAVESALRLASAYELGRFISWRVYPRIMRYCHTAHIPVPQREGEGTEFYESLTDQIAQHYPDALTSRIEYDERAARVYGREVRPQRFASRGGIMTLEAAVPFMDGETCIKHLSDQVFSSYTIEGELPGLLDAAALTPMATRDFKHLCSVVRRVEDPDVIPFDRNS